MREAIREQPEKSESASGELSQTRPGGNPAVKRLAPPVNFLFSAIASFCTFRMLFPSETFFYNRHGGFSQGMNESDDKQNEFTGAGCQAAMVSGGEKGMIGMTAMNINEALCS